MDLRTRLGSRSFFVVVVVVVFALFVFYSTGEPYILFEYCTKMWIFAYDISF